MGFFWTNPNIKTIKAVYKEPSTILTCTYLTSCSFAFSCSTAFSKRCLQTHKVNHYSKCIHIYIHTHTRTTKHMTVNKQLLRKILHQACPHLGHLRSECGHDNGRNVMFCLATSIPFFARIYTQHKK